MATEDYFSTDFDGARDRFLAACRALRVRPVEITTPSLFGGGVPLVDILRLGDPAARRILVLGGGDQLADALCCSAIQTGWLNEFGAAALPPDTALVLLHHGAAPQAGGEAPARESAVPRWDNDLLAKVEERYAVYAAEKGVDHMGAPLPAASAGNSDIPGYPNAILDAVARHLTTANGGRFVFIDVAVGLGPYGEAAIIACHPPGTPAADRIRTWFALPPLTEDEPHAQGNPGSMTAGLMRRFAGTDISTVRLEFGTYSMMSVLGTLLSKKPGQAALDPAKLLSPDTADWREAVWRNAIMNIQQALTALRSG